MYKGIVKVTYDRGYALQTKSLLMENTTTTADAVVQLFEALGLRGSPSDYALEERNIVTGGMIKLSPIIQYKSTKHVYLWIQCIRSNNYK